MYASLYDEKHRFWILSAKGPKPSWSEQKGLRERLLCDDCEGRLNVWETYTSLLLSNRVPTETHRTGDLFWVNGADYTKFKLFQLSILWRAGVSSLPFFSKVRLGPHSEKLRLRLLESDPGKATEYGCALFAHTKEDGVDGGLIVQPILAKLDGHHCYHFVFGGLTWLFIASSHSMPKELTAAFIQPDGRFAFMAHESFGQKYIEKLAEDFHRAKDRNDDAP